ncbi:MAG: hypothetical protein JWQ96_412 [Segetibacter sp.]|nr:hypothetical protein [Segetibacter sp.]
MRKLLLTALLFAAAVGVWAQDKTSNSKKSATKATKGYWKKGGMLSLTLSQGGTRNWAPGGDRFTLAGNTFINLYGNKTKGRCNWDNMLDANFGLQNSDVYGILKNDDKLDLVSRWSHELGKKDLRHFRLGALLNFRTQFVDGYDYDNVKKRISTFLAPATTVLSAGVQYYTKDKAFNLHVGPAGRWILVANRPFELARNYDVSPNKEVRIEAGLFSSATLNKEIVKNVSYRGRLDLFSDFLHDKPTNVDVFFTNMFYLKVNKYFGVTYNFDLQYDDNTRIFGYEKNKAGTQLKSIVGVGLTMKF